MIDTVKKIFSSTNTAEEVKTSEPVEEIVRKYPNIKSIEIESFKQLNETIAKYENVVLDFWAPWCGPCRMLMSVLEDISYEDNNIVILKINTDENMGIADKLKIKSVPTLVFFKDNIETYRHIGIATKAQILEEFNL